MTWGQEMCWGACREGPDIWVGCWSYSDVSSADAAPPRLLQGPRGKPGLPGMPGADGLPVSGPSFLFQALLEPPPH